MISINVQGLDRSAIACRHQRCVSRRSADDQQSASGVMHMRTALHVMLRPVVTLFSWLNRHAGGSLCADAHRLIVQLGALDWVPGLLVPPAESASISGSLTVLDTSHNPGWDMSFGTTATTAVPSLSLVCNARRLVPAAINVVMAVLTSSAAPRQGTCS